MRTADAAEGAATTTAREAAPHSLQDDLPVGGGLEREQVCLGRAERPSGMRKGTHFVQEDSPNEIGSAVADFVRGLRH